MTRIIERIEAHYESREVPFGKTYEWHPGYAVLECDCGEELTLTSTTTITRCPVCGTDYGAVVRDLREREGGLRDELNDPWFYDAEERAGRHQRDEGIYPKGSPWRDNDITGVDDS